MYTIASLNQVTSHHEKIIIASFILCVSSFKHFSEKPTRWMLTKQDYLHNTSSPPPPDLPLTCLPVLLPTHSRSPSVFLYKYGIFFHWFYRSESTRQQQMKVWKLTNLWGAPKCEVWTTCDSGALNRRTADFDDVFLCASLLQSLTVFPPVFLSSSPAVTSHKKTHNSR